VKVADCSFKYKWNC